MNKALKIFLSCIAIVLSSTSFAEKPVSVKGMSSNDLRSFFEGVAKVAEVSATTNYLVKNNLSTDDLMMFYATRALNPVFSMMTLTGTSGSMENYQEGVVQASQISALERYKFCIHPKQTLDSNDIKEAVESKFDGVFEFEHIGVLIVGAWEALFENYPCS